MVLGRQRREEGGLREQKRRLKEGKKEGRERVTGMLCQVMGVIISTLIAFCIPSFQSGGGKIKREILYGWVVYNLFMGSQLSKTSNVYPPLRLSVFH